ncbi:uncharacterized protein LOC108090290 [Drosophila ficusphila]|uniref:uncharacterized protein LOC108090290 n=1 Tax=Drosophila ficusphila TaxID=30025 RepID=UPI0007E694E1|nr:uncharacterized protein LOC108090290 [Drosophila ficusphila]
MLKSVKDAYVGIAISFSSIIVPFLTFWMVTTWVETNKCWDISVWKHLYLLQIVGGLSLLVGSIKLNHWLFLPWIFAGCIFIYTLLYKSFVYFFSLEGIILQTVPLLLTTAGFWSYFVYDVFQEFLHFYGKSINKISTIDSV